MDGWSGMDEEGWNGNERWMYAEEWLMKDGWMNEVGWMEKAVIVMLENHMIRDKRHRMVKICGVMMKK